MTPDGPPVIGHKGRGMLAPSVCEAIVSSWQAANAFSAATPSNSSTGDNNPHPRAKTNSNHAPAICDVTTAATTVMCDIAALMTAWRAQRETLRDQLAAKAAEPIDASRRIVIEAVEPT